MLSLLRRVLLCTVWVLVVTAQPPQCHEYSTALVSSVSDPRALRVQIFENSTSGFTKLIEGHSLPSECGADFRKCNLEKIFDRYLVVPATGNIVILNLHPTNSSPEVVELDCNPTNIFFDGVAHLWVTCIGDSDLRKVLRHLAFTVSLTDEGISLTRNHRRSSTHINISPGGFSETLVVSGCNDVRLYTVIDNQKIWYFPISMYVTPQFDHTEVFENCDEVAYLEHFNRKKSFTIHCSNGISVRYRTCGNHFQYFNLSGNGTQYSCPDDTVIYSPDYITFRNQTVDTYFNHSFGAIKHGACQGSYFTVIAGDGSLNVVHLGTGVATMIARSVCEGGGNDSCVRPSFSPISSAPGFLVYDTAESLLKSVSELEDCPVTETYADSSVPRPSLMSITGLGKGVDCQCQDTEISTTTTSAVTTMETTGSEGKVTEDSTKGVRILESGGKVISVVLPPVAVVIFLIACALLFVLILVCSIVRRSQTKKKKSLKVRAKCSNFSNRVTECDSSSDSDDPPQRDGTVTPAESTDMTAGLGRPSEEQGLDEWGTHGNKTVNTEETNRYEVLPFPSLIQMDPEERGQDTPDSSQHAGHCLFVPSVDRGNGHNSQLVNNGLGIPPYQLSPWAVAENAERQYGEDRQNDIARKVYVMQHMDNTHH